MPDLPGRGAALRLTGTPPRRLGPHACHAVARRPLRPPRRLRRGAAGCRADLDPCRAVGDVREPDDDAHDDHHHADGDHGQAEAQAETEPAATSAPTRTATPRPRASTPAAPRAFTVKGSTRNAIAFAPLSNPGAVTLEGSVPSQHAWSTSKVLVVAAHLDTVVDGDPSKLTASQKSLVTRALTASDGDAVVALRNQIPGSPGAAINRVLRSIGDTRTSAPDTSQGLMQWTIREQVRFMAALSSGRVVSRAASSYLLSSMRPIERAPLGAGPHRRRGRSRAAGCGRAPRRGRWASSTGTPSRSSPTRRGPPSSRPTATRRTCSR